MKTPVLRSFRLRNFKAVRDSGVIRFDPLTVFIGNNGSGKSSITEGLETLQAIIEHGLDKAMQSWHGFEQVWNRGASHELRRHAGERPYHTNPMAFDAHGRIERTRFAAKMEINLGDGGNELFIQREAVSFKDGHLLERNSTGKTILHSGGNGAVRMDRVSQLTDGQSCWKRDLEGFADQWQFVSLVPEMMGSPVPQRRTGGQLRLAKNGANVAEYLLEIRKLDQISFGGIFEAIHSVLPYARDLQAAVTSEIERSVYLQLTEADFKVPGWLLSTGTLRLVALLALLRHPSPPPLIVVEEIENGLDPRTIHLLVEEIRAAITTGKTQVIATTHSPYLLDLLDLRHIVVVERVNGQPTFMRPNEEELGDWVKKFSPGRLYTMGRLTRGD